MKPLDPQLLTAFPGIFSGPSILPSRPWWKQISKGYARNVSKGYARNDGKSILSKWETRPRGYVDEDDPVDNSPDVWLYDGKEYPMGSAAELMERIDKEHPIPHPGFRVGQVWAMAEEGSVIQKLVIGVRLANPFYPSEGYRAICVGGPECGSLLLDHVLLYDPVCPHLAPWSPVE